MSRFYSVNCLTQLKDFFSCLMINGPWQTFQLIFSTLRDSHFDKDNHVKTSAPLTALLQKSKANSPYRPTRGMPLLKFLEQIQLPTSATFVDIGCGYGRVLFVAHQFGFRRLIGVEIEHEMLEIARQNLLPYSSNHQTPSFIQLIAGNICDLQLTEPQNIAFFYGPFISQPDLKLFLDTLVQKKKVSGMDQYFIYHCNIRSTTPVDGHPGFQLIHDCYILGNRFWLFKSI